jgi:hypothetical protein
MSYVHIDVNDRDTECGISEDRNRTEMTGRKESNLRWINYPVRRCGATKQRRYPDWCRKGAGNKPTWSIEKRTLLKSLKNLVSHKKGAQKILCQISNKSRNKMHETEKYVGLHDNPGFQSF